MTEHEKLLDIITGGRRLVVFLHDNPDPDAMASAWILAHIATSVGVRSRIVYGGRIRRAENRAMVQLLKMPIHCMDDLSKPLRYLKSDRFALVDTQPNTGNNIFPASRLPCHIVIDHHPKGADVHADLLDIRPEQGCCTTMLLDYFEACALELHPDLATAAAYAIISETQDLGREATRQDRKALPLLMPQVRLPLLGRMRHPPREREYYRTIARAMQKVLLAQNLCVCHIGEVHSPEMVAEVADFLVAMERTTWCLVTGLHGRTITLSIRTTRRRANAERVMKRILRRRGKGGGHNMIAGGAMPCGSAEEYPDLTDALTKSFIRQLRRNIDMLYPLLNGSG